jgi:small subunit ribosomal protein S6
VPNYELVYIIDPVVTDEALSNVLGKVNEYVTKTGGTVNEVVQWGRKKMAYPIKKCKEGNYKLARIDLKPSAIRELEASLKLSNEVIRHLLIRANA